MLAGLIASALEQVRNNSRGSNFRCCIVRASDACIGLPRRRTAASRFKRPSMVRLGAFQSCVHLDDGHELLRPGSFVPRRFSLDPTSPDSCCWNPQISALFGGPARSATDFLGPAFAGSNPAAPAKPPLAIGQLGFGLFRLSLSQLENKPSDSLLVSVADKIHNAEAILNDWRAEGESVWSRFKGGKDGTMWYYESLAAAFERLLPGPPSSRLGRAVALLRMEACTN